MPFRDVWVVSAAEGEAVRVTDFGAGRAEDGPGAGGGFPDESSFQALARSAAERSRRGVSEVVWTPDSNELILSFEGDLYRVGADGSDLTRLTHAEGGGHDLAFSPDGETLSFLKDGDLWLWKLSTRAPVQVTRVGKPPIGSVPGARYTRADVELSSPTWSPDGRSIALHFDDRTRVREVLIPNYLGDETAIKRLRRDYPGDNDHVRRVAIYSVAEGRLRFVVLPDDTDRRISHFAWSPDGSALLVDQNSEDAVHRWIYAIDPDDLSVREIWHDARESRTTQLWSSTWSSDGKNVLFVTDVDGRHRIYALPLAGGDARRLTEGDWSVLGYGFDGSSLAVRASTKSLYFVATKKSPYERQVYRMPEGGGPVEAVTTLPGTHVPYVSPDGSKVALLHSNDVTPTELYIAETSGTAEERRITQSPPEEFYRHRWIAPEYVTFKSHVDGATLHGRLLKPANLDPSKKYPVILGPVYANTVRNQWRGTYATLQQYLALEGEYIGFHVDVRGSSGHGREFREKLLLDYGGIDIDDLHSGVLYLKSLPYVDGERIGIWGSSYGGLMTVMSLFKKPGVYKAGVAGAPATNVWHATTGEVHVAARPNTHPEVYRGSSAISFGEELRDHLMIIHGMQDSVVLFKDSIVLAEKLMMMGKDFDFVVAPSAVHGWAGRDYAATYLLRKLVGHFDRHLGRGGRPRSTDE